MAKEQAWQELVAEVVAELKPTRAAAAAGVREGTLLAWVNGTTQPSDAARPEYTRRLAAALKQWRKEGTVTV